MANRNCNINNYYHLQLHLSVTQHFTHLINRQLGLVSFLTQVLTVLNLPRWNVQTHTFHLWLHSLINNLK